MVIDMKENGRMTSEMAKGLGKMQMVVNIKEIIHVIKLME